MMIIWSFHHEIQVTLTFIKFVQIQILKDLETEFYSSNLITKYVVLRQTNPILLSLETASLNPRVLLIYGLFSFFRRLTGKYQFKHK